MAIIDTEKTKKPYLIDRDTNRFVGLDFPLSRGVTEGNFKCTKTVIEAVKINLKNLLQTELGERVFQPTLGIKLRQFLFEPFTEEVKVSIQDSIIKTFNYWLPFVIIREVNINMSKHDDDVDKNILSVFVSFAVNSSPSVLETITVQYGV